MIKLLTLLALTTTALAQPVVFSAVGCGPYLDKDIPAVLHYLKQENAEGTSQFIVHLGDIVPGAVGRLMVQPAAFRFLLEARKAVFFQGNKIPVIPVLGDNEWNDTPNAAGSYEVWAKTFLGLEKQFPNAPELQMDTNVPTNFTFQRQGVLFIGIQLVGGKRHDDAEWKTRHLANAAWVKQALESDAGKNTRAMVLLAQANPMIRPKGEPDRFEDFLVPLRAAVAAYAKPTLFLHADGHKWTDDQPWPEKNLRRVQLDLWNTKFPNTQITVADEGDTNTIFQFNRRLKDPKWLYLEPPAP
jgi:hypothetical protein